jgi:hypothetical protein
VKNVETELDKKLTKAFEQSGSHKNSRLRMEDSNQQAGQPPPNDENELQLQLQLQVQLQDLESYPLHMGSGKITMLPEDFEFLNNIVWDCWEWWNMSNV